MPTIKLSVVYMLVLTALILGACFSALTQGSIAALERSRVASTPVAVAVGAEPSGLNQNNNLDNRLLMDQQQTSSKIQVRVQVDATGNANAEGSAKGPNDTNVTAKTNGEGSAVASALSSLPEGVGNTVLVLPASTTATQTTPLQTSSVVATPVATLGPQAVVSESIINLRRGPGIFYDVVGSAARGQVFDIVARTADYQWWQVCCTNNEFVWLNNQVVYVYGQLNTLVVAASPLSPSQIPGQIPAQLPAQANTPALVPTLAPPTVAPVLPTPAATPHAFEFDLVAQEQFEETMTPRIYAYIYAGAEGLGGYTLRVRKDGNELPITASSFGGQPAMTWPLPIARQRFYNLKLEYKDIPVVGNWEVQLVDLAGKVVGPPVIFHLNGSEQNQEMYLRFQKH